MLPEKDTVRLRHMLDAAQAALRFAAGRTVSDLDTDEMLSFGLTRAIEIIGEAAARVSQETREKIPDIPWPGVVGMRHRLVHAYFEIDPDRVWQVVTRDLPRLITALERALTQQGTS